MRNKSRLAYIDALKGITIFLVLLGHNSPNTYITYMIYFFHMPLFFFMSGYLSKGREQITKSLYKKAKTLIYPYIMYGCLIIVYNSLFDYVRHNFMKDKLIKRIIALLYGNYIWENNSDYIGTLWFLVCLFCTVIIGEYIIKNCQKNRWKSIILVLGLILMGWGSEIFKERFNLRLPWCLDVAFVAAIFYMGGYLVKKIKYRFTMRVCVILEIIGIAFGWLNYIYMEKQEYCLLRTDMLNMNYGNMILFLLSSLNICIGTLELFKLLSDKLKISWLEEVGQASMVLMIVHIYVNQIVMMFLNHFDLNRWIVAFPICTGISVLIALILHKKCYYLESFDEMKRRLGWTKGQHIGTT